MMEHITIPIQDELKKMDEVLFAEVRFGIETVDSIAKYVVSSGGRRIRPMLFLLASRMAGLRRDVAATATQAGVKGDKLPRFAAAIELLHAANLLRGDVADDDATGRGQMPAKTKWGNQASVLISDFFLCRAARIFAEHSDVRMMGAATDAIGATTEGELLEIFGREKMAAGLCRAEAATAAQAGSNAHIRMISKKTSSLFAFAGRSAAIVAGLEKNFEDTLEKFGREVGISFGLANDASNHKDSQAMLKLAKEYSEKAKANLSIFKPSIERDSLRALADYVAVGVSE